MYLSGDDTDAKKRMFIDSAVNFNIHSSKLVKELTWEVKKKDGN
jgi:hypothetical protein